MNDLVWSPVLEVSLVGRFHWVDLPWRRSSWILLRFFSKAWVLVEVPISGFQLNCMRVDDLMFLLNIEVLASLAHSNNLDRVIFSMLSGIIGVDALRILISDNLINLLSSPRSSHIVLIIFYELILKMFGRFIESFSRR